MAEEMEGEWVMGWPDRKRARIMPSKDAEGRTIYARSPVLDLEGVLTPTDAYYIVAQLDMPDPVHPDDFSFSIGGMVDSPTEYTLEDIRKLPGRTDFEVVDPGIINYAKALPLEKALHEDTILAWAHNGEYLTHVHGAPLRLVVPGWAGNWWVKWIDKIEVLDHTPDFYYQTRYFVSGDSPDDPDKKPMMALGVKALITSPRDDDGPIKRGTHAVRGRTWSGEGAVVRVEISTDGGETWNNATIEESGDRWLWRRFHYLWEVNESGHYKIMARGTDEKGRVQPAIDWNFQRKHFDGIVPEEIIVE